MFSPPCYCSLKTAYTHVPLGAEGTQNKHDSGCKTYCNVADILIDVKDIFTNIFHGNNNLSKICAPLRQAVLLVDFF